MTKFLTIFLLAGSLFAMGCSQLSKQNSCHESKCECSECDCGKETCDCKK